MVAGQPARAPEILGIRIRNTVNGGLRNIFVHDGMAYFVTSYYKNYRSLGQAKVIHRYAPREVGELLVWYLWLVLPFWQQVQGILKGGIWCSPFWSGGRVKLNSTSLLFVWPRARTSLQRPLSFIEIYPLEIYAQYHLGFGFVNAKNHIDIAAIPSIHVHFFHPLPFTVLACIEVGQPDFGVSSNLLR